MNVTDPRNGNTYYLLMNGQHQILGVLEAPDAAAAESMIQLHLKHGETYGDLTCRPATPAEATAWHLGRALWSAKHDGSWNDLRSVLQLHFDKHPQHRPE